MGPAAGVLARLPLGTHVDIQPELLYEQRGARTAYEAVPLVLGSSGSLVYKHEERNRLHYLSVPVLVRFQKQKWFAVLGPQVSYLLAAQQRVTNTVTYTGSNPNPAIPTGSDTYTVRGVSSYHRWEAGYVVGVGYQVAPRLGVEVRYAAGITQAERPLLYDPTVWTPPSEMASNASVQAQVSYQFGTL